MGLPIERVNQVLGLSLAVVEDVVSAERFGNVAFNSLDRRMDTLRRS